MKATGIVRRIDDLGRVVIPKEIRRTMRIREGDPLEIYTSKEGEVIFKKYSLMGDIDDLAGQFCEALSKNVSGIVAVTDGYRDLHCRRRKAGAAGEKNQWRTGKNFRRSKYLSGHQRGGGCRGDRRK